jgi:hypothetical protein
VLAIAMVGLAMRRTRGAGPSALHREFQRQPADCLGRVVCPLIGGEVRNRRYPSGQNRPEAYPIAQLLPDLLEVADRRSDSGAGADCAAR